MSDGARRVCALATEYKSIMDEIKTRTQGEIVKTVLKAMIKSNRNRTIGQEKFVLNSIGLDLIGERMKAIPFIHFDQEMFRNNVIESGYVSGDPENSLSAIMDIFREFDENNDDDNHVYGSRRVFSLDFDKLK